MKQRAIPIKALIEAAAKPYRELWKDDERLNLGALSRHYAKKGHPLSQASLSRIFSGKQGIGEDAIEATHSVFRIPRSILRGEHVSAEMEKLLADYKVSTLLLAQKLESLPKEDYYVIAQQIERAIERAEEIKNAIQSGGVISLDRHRRV